MSAYKLAQAQAQAALKETLAALPTIKVPTAPIKKPAAPRKPSKKRTFDEPAIGRRVSSRLTSWGEDGTALSREERQKALEDKIERDEQEEAERRAKASVAKHSDRGVEALTSVTGSGSTDSLHALFTSIATSSSTKNATSKSPAKRGGVKIEKKEEEEEGEDVGTRKAFGAVVEGLKLKALVKVVPNRIYSLVVHPSITQDLVFCGDKKGCIGVWDQTNVGIKVKMDEDEEGGGDEGGDGKGKRWYWQAHMENSVSCMKINPTDHASIYSGAYDCSVRKTNFETNQSEEVINGDSSGREMLIHGFDFTPDGNEIWATDTNGGISHRDLREPIQTTRRWEMKDQSKIGGISINPVNPYLAVTSHLKREMRVWDLRKMMGISPDRSVQSACLTTYTYGKACTSAYFDRTGTRILSTSYDDRIRIWSLDPNNIKSIPEVFEPDHTIKHDNQTGAYVSVFKAQWCTSSAQPSSFHIGSMKRYLEVYTASNGELAGQLYDPTEVTSVPAVTGSHPSIANRYFGGTGAGKIVCYA